MTTTTAQAAAQASGQAASSSSPAGLPTDVRDRLYAACARAISEAGVERESLFLARLALLLFEQVGDEARCQAALQEALRDLPTPSLSKL